MLAASMAPRITYEPQETELETNGQFEVKEWTDETTRCGPIGSPRRFAFRVLFMTKAKNLNTQKFIIDWELVHAYFKSTFEKVGKFPSCEQIANQACGDLVGMLEGRCESCEVTVGLGSKAAGMKARWRRPQETEQEAWEEAQ